MKALLQYALTTLSTFIFASVIVAKAYASTPPQPGDVVCQMFYGTVDMMHPDLMKQETWIISKAQIQNGEDPLARIPGGPTIDLDPFDKDGVKVILRAHRMDGAHPLLFVGVEALVKGLSVVSGITIFLDGKIEIPAMVMFSKGPNVWQDGYAVSCRLIEHH